MRELKPGKRLRLYISESDQHQGKALYEVIIDLAHDHGMAGCTVFKGFEGYGAHRQIHTAKILRLSEDLPIVIEIIDQSDKVDTFLAALDTLITEGLVTVENLDFNLYRQKKASQHN